MWLRSSILGGHTLTHGMSNCVANSVAMCDTCIPICMYQAIDFIHLKLQGSTQSDNCISL